ncbi:PRD domain-containing protein [Paenibacillus jiagnxiensis]|uniref:PRD domain-containing protein n=1 Tax=Paenibacillus jiagnxiensis TaxID=3228926 RepID=UPI0033B0BD76
MKINRVLNNNAVVVKEGDVEKIVMGPGVAFQKGKNDLIDPAKIEKTFVLKEESKKFQQLLSSVPESHIAMGEKIISHAEQVLGMSLSNHIHIALTDHLSFAIERYRAGIQVRNKLLNEIRLLYSTEFRIGLWALEQIKAAFGIEFPEDEAAYIALHIHTAKMENSHIEKSIKKTIIIQETVEIMLEELGADIDKNSISYHRLLTHLELALSRYYDQKPFHTLDKDMLKMIKKTYKHGFKAAKKAAAYLAQKYDIEFPESEMAYIALHLQRILEEV